MALSYNNTVGPAASNALSNYLQPKLTLGGGTSQTTPSALPQYKRASVTQVPSSTSPTGSSPQFNAASSVMPAVSTGPSLSIGGPTSTAGTGANANAAAINKAHAATLSALTGGGTASDGTPLLTQAQLTAQNGGVANLPQTASQNNNGTTGGATNIGTPALSYSGLVGGLVGTGQSAANIAADYGQQIANVGKAGAAAQGGYLTTGTTPVAEGRAGVVAQTTALQQQALAQGESAALQGTGQQITAGNEAAGFAQKQIVSPGQAVFDPLAGIYSNASSGGGQASAAPSGIDQTAWNQYVNDYATGNFGAIPSSITGNANLSGQLQQAVQAAHPGFSYNSALGAGQGATTAAATAGSIQSAQSQQIASYKSAQQQGQNLASQVNDLISTFGLNPSDVNSVNAGIQKIANNTSSPQYQILSNYLNDVAARYAQILTPPGGSSTDTTRSIATGMLNATASGTSISQVLKSLDSQASAVIAGIPATGTVPSGASGSVSGFGWDPQ